jgi:hypothetical protein
MAIARSVQHGVLDVLAFAHGFVSVAGAIISMAAFLTLTAFLAPLLLALAALRLMPMAAAGHRLRAARTHAAHRRVGTGPD